MVLTITEVARLLNVKENVVRGYLATGKLAFDVQDGQVVIPQSAVDAWMHPERMSAPSITPSSTSARRSPQEEALRSVLKGLFAIEEQLENKWDLFSENQRLHQLLRERDKALAERNAEIDRLKREMAYQKLLCEKEMHDGERALEERLNVVREQTDQRIAREEESCRERVALVERHWAQRVAEEAERSARQLEDARKQEGFWARLIRIMTWS